jgi:crotonyl-CoA carboxylase/reductase
VLVWGGSGGLGALGIEIADALCGIPVAVVSDDERVAWCVEHGARGFVDRTKYDHWGRLPDWHDDEAMTKMIHGMRGFLREIWDIVGGRRNPRLVLEHPGQDTIPTSLFVCDTNGMVVICAGTSGYNADIDLRYFWTRQKRFQGSHFANDAEAAAVNDLITAGRIDPCLSRTLSFDEVGAAHQLLHDNRHPNGNMSILVGARRAGMKTLA